MGKALFLKRHKPSAERESACEDERRRERREEREGREREEERE